MSSTQESANFNTFTGLNINEALLALTSCRTVHDALGIDQEGLHRRLTSRWTPDLALRDCEYLSEFFDFPAEQSAIVECSPGYDTTFRGDGVSPLLKISPALMHIENTSLQSLTRS